MSALTMNALKRKQEEKDRRLVTFLDVPKDLNPKEFVEALVKDLQIPVHCVKHFRQFHVEDTSGDSYKLRLYISELQMVKTLKNSFSKANADFTNTVDVGGYAIKFSFPEHLNEVLDIKESQSENAKGKIIMLDSPKNANMIDLLKFMKEEEACELNYVAVNRKKSFIGFFDSTMAGNYMARLDEKQIKACYSKTFLTVCDVKRGNKISRFNRKQKNVTQHVDLRNKLVEKRAKQASKKPQHLNYRVKNGYKKACVDKGQKKTATEEIFRDKPKVVQQTSRMPQVPMMSQVPMMPQLPMMQVVSQMPYQQNVASPMLMPLSNQSVIYTSQPIMGGTAQSWMPVNSWGYGAVPTGYEVVLVPKGSTRNL
jgi:hypothetical protein